VTFGDLVDSSDKDFIKYFKDRDLGYCLVVKKLFNLGYDQLIKIKDDLLKEEKTTDYVQAIIYNMALLEHKAIILNRLIKDRGFKIV